MIPFLVELGNFLGTVWGRIYRWALYRKRNLVIGFSVVVTAATLFSVASHTINSATTPRHRAVATATPTPTPTGKYTEIQATAIPTDGATPHKAQQSGVASGDKQHPEEPAINPQDPQSVAEGWAVAYLSRPRSDWEGWRRWVQPHITEQLAEQLTHPVEGTAEMQTLDAAPTRVTGVAVSAPQNDADTNTPIRWSHTLSVTVRTTTSSTVVLVYGVVAEQADAGWMITTVQQLGTSQGE